MSRFRAELVRHAEEELARYGNLFANQSPLKERIDAYWRFLDPAGPPFHAWSAAFISYMAHLAGAGESFRSSYRFNPTQSRQSAATSAPRPAPSGPKRGYGVKVPS